MMTNRAAPPLAPPITNFLLPLEDNAAAAAAAGVDDTDFVGLDVTVEELELLEAEEVDVGFDDE